MTSKSSQSVAIVGGGISGVCLAVALIQRGLNVQIYEQAHKYGEIGAGVAFAPNSIRSMQACSPDIYHAFEKVATRNQTKEKQNVWFDFKDGYSDAEIGSEKILFTLKNDTGSNCVHRAHFLDEMVKLVPEGITHFHKHLDTIEQGEEGEQLTLKFHDGTTAKADAVIGCDGIKSRVRAWMLGEDHPATPPVYTHKYAYRGLIPMAKAIEALGEDNAVNAKFYVNHITMYCPVSTMLTSNSSAKMATS
jgi:salicylate hydroxylase